MAFKLVYDKEALAGLKELKSHEAAVILKAIQLHLTTQPATETSNRKLLRQNPFFTWEMRIQPFRVFYQADEGSHSANRLQSPQ